MPIFRLPLVSASATTSTPPVSRGSPGPSTLGDGVASVRNAAGSFGASAVQAGDERAGKSAGGGLAQSVQTVQTGHGSGRSPVKQSLAARRAAGAKLGPIEVPKAAKESGPGAVLLDRLGTSDHRSGLFAQMLADIGPPGTDSRFLIDVPGARHREVPTAAATQVIAPDGTALPANRVKVGGQNVCIASQYPTAEQTESYLRMVAANRTPVLVVLASDGEIALRNMPRYFSESGQYGNVDVTVTHASSNKLADTMSVRTYTMEIMDNAAEKNVRIRVPVLHVQDWADRAGQSAAALDALATEVDRIEDQQIDRYKLAQSTALADPDKLLPVIHCVAGVGRTGQLIVARELKKGSGSVESILTDTRNSRNHLMVQTKAQFDPLIELAGVNGRPILSPERHDSTTR